MTPTPVDIAAGVNFAAEWIKKADDSGTVQLPADQLAVDESGRPIILSDLGISSTIQRIAQDGCWSKAHYAYAARLSPTSSSPENGPVAVMINGNHRLRAIQSRNLVLPDGIPVRIGPPLASEHERYVIAAALNADDLGFRKYSVAERLLAIDSTCAHLVTQGITPSSKVLREILMRNVPSEGANRVVERWFTAWLSLFTRDPVPDQRSAIRERLR